MTTYKNKKNRKKTEKKRIVNLNNVNIKYYSSYYKNTNNIPKTQIINYLLNNFNHFLDEKKLAESVNKYPLNLEDCFKINPDDFPKGIRKNKIELSLKMNPKTPLNKLIAYCFYLKQPAIFETDKTIEAIKFQIGKDVGRDDRNINGKNYNQEYYQSKASNSYDITDLFYQNIIDYLYQIKNTINLDIVNKFGLLSCQNIYGLITDLITIKINDILKPELNSVFRPEKYANIIIKQNEISIEFYFKTQMLITRDGEPFDPEYPCGNMEFSFYIDILNNKYELRNFKFDYDIDKCGPEIESNKVIANKEKVFESKLKPEIILPAAGISAGLIATPFLLGVLGGKRKKRNKTIKKKRKVIK